MKRRLRVLLKASLPLSDVRRRRAFQQRIDILYGILFVCLLIIIARLMELQIIRGKEYEIQARAQHFGGIELPAKRGEIFSRNSKTGEKNLLATNTTLDLLYVDPFVAKDEHTVADVLGRTLLTQEFDQHCRSGNRECPREFRKYYIAMFDPVNLNSDASLSETLPTYDAIVKAFVDNIEQRISEEFVSYVPLLYGANKVQMKIVGDYGIPGIYAPEEQKVIYADPLQIPDFERYRIAKILAPVLNADVSVVQDSLRKRRLRYVPILRRLPPDMSKEIKKLKEESARATTESRLALIERGKKDEADRMEDPLRGIALIPEHWRIYPDGTVASQVVGFVREPPPGLSLTVKEQPQNGIERVFDYELRGQHGEISTVIDPFGGQIFSNDQTIKKARDGRSIVLTIDRYLQKQVEMILQRAMEEYQADSGQVVIIDPNTGRVIVMANAPLSNSNNYSGVFEKVTFAIPSEREPTIVVEVYNPITNTLIMRGYLNDMTPYGRVRLSKELQQNLHDLEQVYNLEDLKRYYYYLGDFSRIELFPVCPQGQGPSTAVPRLLEEEQEQKNTQNGASSGCTWLRYKNGIGVGAYVNRVVQEIYEPGSVFKPITMSIAIDQGEVIPDDRYFDEGSVVIDEYVIENANRRIFGELNMTDCLSFSVNTCMTNVSRKLGKKLFANYIRRFGLGKITGIQLEDEKPGNILDWGRWSDALLATAAFGQGISATPIQIATAFSALANGGKLMKPTIVDSWIDPDGTEHLINPRIVEQVITEETAATITAMLTRGMNEGFAKKAKVPGYRMAGKTGTSQIAKPGGGYEEAGTGSAITSFAGYAPVDRPKFVMLVKFDRPRAREYGENTAAPVFKQISEILFEYYGIPPDEE